MYEQGYDYKVLDPRIAELYNDPRGYTEAQIGRKLGLSQSTVNRRVNAMIAEGKLKKRPKTSAKWRNPNSRRVRTFRRLARRNATLQEIADALDSSLTVAWRLRKRIAQYHGSSYIRAKVETWSARRAAKRLGITRIVLMRVCRDLDLVPERRGVVEYAFTKEDLEAIRRQLRKERRQRWHRRKRRE